MSLLDPRTPPGKIFSLVLVAMGLYTMWQWPTEPDAYQDRIWQRVHSHILSAAFYTEIASGAVSKLHALSAAR